MKIYIVLILVFVKLVFILCNLDTPFQQFNNKKM